jgi:hypothetical protein
MEKQKIQSLYKLAITLKKVKEHRSFNLGYETYVNIVQGSSQGILAFRAGTRAPHDGTHETLNKTFYFFYLFIFFK